MNHIAKRFETALREVVKKCRINKITLGGKSYGSLKDTTINKLTKYYHSAILGNRDKGLEATRKAVFATLRHCSSIDLKPDHKNCPNGEDSWCFFKRNIACGKPPGSHSVNITTPLNCTVVKHIAPVYERLADRSLLGRCLKGQTQN